ncbi:hypothetical protein STSP2_00958 [Anaerohalosphaera lusitana]|uniref:Uncharacterized protein n=1 Tax=Anaerohalosphaera lusitana TaxID=1936003 RepID=A0A1U9NJ91_9BACT|nr:DUF6345 domain-containing protein [Anaerohalosphaera lusitana]AQT67808.1 hypothetical protein STSP2_00958 [Anaerohalosphaera lusitana]
MRQKLTTTLLILALITLPASAQEVFPDLTGDDFVDMQDFAVLAGHWLEHEPIPEQMPVYVVTGAGASQTQAEQLAAALNIPEKEISNENGTIVFVDPVNFQSAPTLEIQDPAIREALLGDTRDVDNAEVIRIEGFDFAALQKIQPVPGDVAADIVSGALEQANLTPWNAQPTISNATLETVDLEGKPIIEPIPLDTRIDYNFQINNTELQGPGALLNVTLSPGGVVTGLHHSTRQLAKGDPVPLVQPVNAIKNFAQTLPSEIGTTAKSLDPAPDAKITYNLDAELIYYAPSLEFGEASAIIPAYNIGGSITVGEQTAQLLRRTVPATNDPQFVPQVDLSATADGSEIFASTTVEGGTPPYTYDWTSSNMPLYKATSSQINYALVPREDTINSEMVSVTVTDTNGVSVTKSAILQVSVSPSSVFAAASAPVGGVSDYGIERAVSDMGGANQRNFANRFNSEGVTQRFNWTGKNSWEADFKEDAYDSSYVDNVDICFYIGHGWPGGFTFESSNTDGSIRHNESGIAWGNKDLEFLSLLSCQVLKSPANNQSAISRWRDEFAGLHLLTGFHTNAHDWGKFSKRYAQYMLGRNFAFTTVTLPVRAAWFKAKQQKQPSGNRAAVMGPIGPNGTTNYNDYYWGQGPIGPDIRGSNIQGFWYVSYK